MKLKESLEIFEIEEGRGGNFRIIKQPSILFQPFKTSCGWYIKTCAYPDFVTSCDTIRIYLRGTTQSRDLIEFRVPAQHIQNFKQSIKEFCEEMKWELVVSNDRYLGHI